MLACQFCAVGGWKVVGTPLVLRLKLDNIIMPPSGFLVKLLGKMGMAR